MEDPTPAMAPLSDRVASTQELMRRKGNSILEIARYIVISKLNNF